MKNILPYLVLALTATLASGCGCTLVGCNGAMGFKVNAALTSFEGSFPVKLEACADTLCFTFTLDKDAQGNLTCASPDENLGTCKIASGSGDVELIVSDFGEVIEDESTVKITVKSASALVVYQDSTVVETTADSPNGETCGPTCRGGYATFTPTSK